MTYSSQKHLLYVQLKWCVHWALQTIIWLMLTYKCESQLSTQAEYLGEDKGSSFCGTPAKNITNSAASSFQNYNSASAASSR